MMHKAIAMNRSIIDPSLNSLFMSMRLKVMFYSVYSYAHIYVCVHVSALTLIAKLVNPSFLFNS